MPPGSGQGRKLPVRGSSPMRPYSEHLRAAVPWPRRRSIAGKSKSFVRWISASVLYPRSARTDKRQPISARSQWDDCSANNTCAPERFSRTRMVVLPIHTVGPEGVDASMQKDSAAAVLPTALAENQAGLYAKLNFIVHSGAMSVAARNPAGARSQGKASRASARKSSIKAIRVSKLLKLRECEQVAAVCYRLRRGLIEFLLVQTRGSKRWTFPKGSAEPGLTHAQAAAIEAFEEAGVHGRIEEAAFVTYVCGRPCDAREPSRSTTKAIVVSGHLCEVRRLCTPKEANRNRTWFAPEDAKKRLREGRKETDGEEFARVVQRAVARIQRSLERIDLARGAERHVLPPDALRKVHFEAFQPISRRLSTASTQPYTRRPHAAAFTNSTRGEVMDCDVLPFNALRPFAHAPKLLPGSRKLKALGTGSKNN